MQKITLWEYKDAFLMYFCSFLLQNEQEQAPADFFQAEWQFHSCWIICDND